jgi:hypothetical protein
MHYRLVSRLLKNRRKYIDENGKERKKKKTKSLCYWNI